MQAEKNAILNHRDPTHIAILSRVATPAMFVLSNVRVVAR
jgi:hypothetical protein